MFRLGLLHYLACWLQQHDSTIEWFGVLALVSLITSHVDYDTELSELSAILD